MHGLIFAELKKYVVARLGGPAWNRLLEQARMDGAIFLPNEIYPDEQLVRLVSAGSQITGMSMGALLEDFGEFITPDLLRLYQAQVDPRWGPLEFIEHTEEFIHRAVRIKMPGASPPQLVVRREAKDRVTLVYSSARHLCGVAKGIIKGVARHYGKPLQLQETGCMTQGAPRCEIQVRQGA